MKALRKFLYGMGILGLYLLCLKGCHTYQINGVCALYEKIALGQSYDAVMKTAADSGSAYRAYLYSGEKSIEEKLVCVERRGMFFVTYFVFINFKEGVVSAYVIRDSDSLTDKPGFAPEDVLGAAGAYTLLKFVCYEGNKSDTLFTLPPGTAGRK